MNYEKLCKKISAENMSIEEEYNGGYVIRNCPHCGQFCKVPNYYKAKWNGNLFIGCYAKSYCKRCKKQVELEVEFI